MGSLSGFRLVAGFFTLAACLFAAGCGTPGAPQPPSLNLPDPVEDLHATRAGKEVSLSWTMPKKTTDRLMLREDIQVQVCRKLAGSACDPVATAIAAAPGTNGAFTETLPAPLAAGAARPLSYFVELRNRSGRSAGLSNAAVVLAGEAPPPIAGLAAEVRKEGVVLRWAAAEPPHQTAVRLHRKLLTPAAAKPKPGLLTPQPEAIDQSLLVQASPATPDRALDSQIEFGQTYEYRAQRVARVLVDGRTLELPGELSAPLRVEAVDVFPPAVPTELAAVATPAQDGAAAAIDLSWQPVTDADLAGYAVYRREADAAWQRISPAKPVPAPGFHDAQVQAGHIYRYAVTAIDQGGHESARSTETEETVPNP